MRVHRHMRLREELLHRLAFPHSHVLRAAPFLRGTTPLWLGVRAERDSVERLQDADEHERSLVVGEFLAQTEPGACVEGEKDEWVGR